VRCAQTARRLALEWQAWLVRTHALRRVFVSVKGFYLQADVLGQPVTWLVPHALAQVPARTGDLGCSAHDGLKCACSCASAWRVLYHGGCGAHCLHMGAQPVAWLPGLFGS